jgi:hypothetical protein
VDSAGNDLAEATQTLTLTPGQDTVLPYRVRTVQKERNFRNVSLIRHLPEARTEARRYSVMVRSAEPLKSDSNGYGRATRVEFLQLPNVISVQDYGTPVVPLIVEAQYQNILGQQSVYAFYLPNGTYVLSMDENILGNRLELAQNNFEVTLDGDIESVYTSFYIVEKERTVKVKKFGNADAPVVLPAGGRWRGAATPVGGARVAGGALRAKAQKTGPVTDRARGRRPETPADGRVVFRPAERRPSGVGAWAAAPGTGSGHERVAGDRIRRVRKNARPAHFLFRGARRGRWVTSGTPPGIWTPSRTRPG